MIVVVKQPGESAVTRDVADNGKVLRAIVGGPLESVVTAHDFDGDNHVVIYVNEEAQAEWVERLPPPCFWRPSDGQLIRGNAVAVAFTPSGESASLSPEAANRIVALFAAWSA